MSVVSSLPIKFGFYCYSRYFQQSNWCAVNKRIIKNVKKYVLEVILRKKCHFQNESCLNWTHYKIVEKPKWRLPMFYIFFMKFHGLVSESLILSLTDFHVETPLKIPLRWVQSLRAVVVLWKPFLQICLYKKFIPAKIGTKL